MLGNMSERSSKISALEIMINNKSILSDAGGRSYHNLFRLTIVVSLICLSSFYFGFSLTYLSTVPTSTLVLSYGKQISNATINSVLIGAVPVGAIFGSLLANPMMLFFTRRNMILFLNILVLMVNAFIQIANVYVLLACRLLSGIFVGAYLGIVPIYVHQLCPHAVAGSFGAFTQLAHILGVVICYLCGLFFDISGTDNQQYMWRIMFSLTSPLVLLQTILIVVGYIPESPNSLIQKDQISKAKQVLVMFHNPDPKHIDELVQEKKLENEQVDRDQTISINETLTVDKIKMTCISGFLGFQLPLMQQLSGINFIVTQMGQLTGQYDPTIQPYSALVANSIEFIATALSILLLVKVGRKPLIKGGNFGVAFLNIAIGILFIYIDWEPAFTLILVLIGVYMVVFGFTIGPVIWLYVPEILPTKMVPIATIMNWLGCSICVIIPPIIISAMGNPYAVFLFLGGIELAFFIPNLFFVKETKGLAPYEINAKFHQ